MTVAGTLRMAAAIAEMELGLSRTHALLRLFRETFGPLPDRVDPFKSRRVATIPPRGR